jgi:hypothetical protein
MPDATSVASVVYKRWRAWLRAIHRDFGYVAVGFTVIYALSGLAINHIKDWDPSFTSTEITKPIEPIGDDVPDDVAVQRVTAATGMGKPDDVFRAGDELRLGYESGAQVTVVGDQVTIQDRSPRFFLRIANWLHYNRGKKAWTYVADVYAVMLLYLAISGIFMIKGKLGLRWRGAVLVSFGIAVPAAYVALSGGPSAHSGDDKTTTAVAPAAPTEHAERPPVRPPVRTPAGSDEPHLNNPDVPAPISSDDQPKLKAAKDIPGLTPEHTTHPTHGSPGQNSVTGLKNPFDPHSDAPPHPKTTPDHPATDKGSPADTTLERP